MTVKTLMEYLQKEDPNRVVIVMSSEEMEEPVSLIWRSDVCILSKRRGCDFKFGDKQETVCDEEEALKLFKKDNDGKTMPALMLY